MQHRTVVYIAGSFSVLRLEMTRNPSALICPDRFTKRRPCPTTTLLLCPSDAAGWLPSLPPPESQFAVVFRSTAANGIHCWETKCWAVKMTLCECKRCYLGHFGVLLEKRPLADNSITLGTWACPRASVLS